jgi:hypothetical protein
MPLLRRALPAAVRCLRETAPPAPQHEMGAFHLGRLRLTQAQYTSRSQQQARTQCARSRRARVLALTRRAQADARAAYLAAMADPTLGNVEKHNVEATYHTTFGRRRAPLQALALRCSR